MKINNNDILDLINKERDYIDKYALETTKGTKVMKNKFHKKAVADRNSYIRSKITEYTNYKNSLNDFINKRVNKIFPQNNSENFSKKNNKKEEVESILMLNNKYGSINYKLGLTKYIYDLNDFDNTNLSEINNRIKKIMKILEAANINLSLNLFSYSTYTYEYMKCFLENINSNDFDNVLQKTFENIFWECPKIIDHLRLNFNYIVNSNQKLLTLYCNNLMLSKLSKNNINKKDLFNIYNNLSNEIDRSIKLDSYEIVNKFLNREVNINDYLENSSIRISNYNSLTKNNNFNELSEFEKKDFYKQINELGNTLNELEKYYLFKPIIEDLLKYYSEKKDIRKEFESKAKNISIEEKKREKLYKKYITSTKGNIFGKIDSKLVNINKLNLNKQIDNLSNLYKEIDDIEISLNINNYIDDTSSIYDLLLVAFSSYKYLKKIYIDKYVSNDYSYSLEYFMNELFEYLFNSKNNFIYKTSIDNNIDIKESISNKFNLLNINISIDSLEKDNLPKIKDVVGMINLIDNINNSSIILDDILFIFEAKNL